jgi:hypothetical protein
MLKRIPWQDVCKFLAGAFFGAALVKVFGRLRDDPTTRADGRRTKSANGRNRERRRGYGAAGSWRV